MSFFKYNISTRLNRDEAALGTVGLEMGTVLSAFTFWIMVKEKV